MHGDKQAGESNTSRANPACRPHRRTSRCMSSTLPSEYTTARVSPEADPSPPSDAGTSDSDVDMLSSTRVSAH